MILLIALLFAAFVVSMPPPFTRSLSSGMSGSDVLLLQNLLQRTNGLPSFQVNGKYDAATVAAVEQFQRFYFQPPNGVFDDRAAKTLLSENSNGTRTDVFLFRFNIEISDNYKDPLVFPLPAQYKYKVHIPVNENRSIETMATLYANNGTVLHRFVVRTHGQDDASTGEALNQFCGDGSTPTGLTEADYDSPEPDPISYGKFPVNRLFKGLEGNSVFCMSNETSSTRNGILMHTGEWQNWTPKQPMPNSHGCVHAHPTDAKKVFSLLIDLGVVVRKNPFNSIHYPFKGYQVFFVCEFV